MHEDTLRTIERAVLYDDGYGLFSMDVGYGYDLDRIISRGISDDQSAFDAVIDEVLPGTGIRIRVPSFACTTVSLPPLTGRNYDFLLDTSAMMVRCSPDDGYRSIGFAALDNLSANSMSTERERTAALLSPFVCLDGMNEKGVTISILTLDSPPVDQRTGRSRICTSMAVRLVLDRCASTQEAVELLGGYDMRAIGGRDYHFYITDASGDARAVEYDCDSGARELVSTESDVMTNFFVMHEELYGTDRRYGHGKDRFDRVKDVLRSNPGGRSEDVAWQALRAAAQEPRPGDPTSNTQWSVVYDSRALVGSIALRRHWDDVFVCDLRDGGPVRAGLRTGPPRRDASSASVRARPCADTIRARRRRRLQKRSGKSVPVLCQKLTNL